VSSEDEGLLPGLFRDVLGMRKSVSGSDGRQWFFFWLGGIGDGTRRHPDPWNSSYVSLYVSTSNSPNLCIHVLYHMFWG
jgi:hypothetical protein